MSRPGTARRFDFYSGHRLCRGPGLIDGNAYVNNRGQPVPGMDTWEKWESYTFADVREDHTISVTFGEDTNNNNVPRRQRGTVTLTYNANGGEGSAPADQSAAVEHRHRGGKHLHPLRLQLCRVEHPGGRRGEDYAAGDAFQLTGQDAVLYAQWSYNGGGSTGTARYTIEASAGHGGGSARTAGCG